MPRRRAANASSERDGAASGASSIALVAERAGVSKATVSRVMNGITNKVSAETRSRVLDVVQALSYRPSRAGSALRQGRSHLVGLLVADPGNAYHASVAGSVERALRAEGKVMVLANTSEDPAVQDDMLREMRALSAAGIVMLSAIRSAELENSLQAGEPIVFVNRRSPCSLPATFVGIDNARAGREVAEHLAAAGHRRIWLFHSALTSSATRDRVGGFQRRFRALTGAEGSVHGVTVSTQRKESAYAHACALLESEAPPDAVFCTTDEIAYGVAKRCLEIGLRIPADVAIFGFDGNPLNEFLAPWLSTIRVPYEDVGPAVVAILNAIWRQDGTPQDVILLFRKVIAPGGSSRSP